MRTTNTENPVFQAVQEKFQLMYPYLTLKQAGVVNLDGRSNRVWACEDFFKEAMIRDEMNVANLEAILRQWFGCPVQILRKCGNLWLETTMTRNWTVRQQNDLGWHITAGTL